MFEFRLAYDRFLLDAGTKHMAFYESLREAILSGQLPYGTRLPSSRSLAAMYGVSRGVVTEAYDMLYSEGYVTARKGSGTFTAYRPPDSGPIRHAAAKSSPVKNVIAESSAASPNRDGFSFAGTAWARRLLATHETEGRTVGEERGQLFSAGLTDERLFPTAEWKSCMYAEVRQSGTAKLAKDNPTEGDFQLRSKIASELRRERGIVASPEHIVLTNGSMQAVGILCQLLVEPGISVVLENPCYRGFKRAVSAAGGAVVSASVDEQGIVPRHWDSSLLFVTPSRQFPTGAVLSHQRRTALLHWAAERGALIVEDDYDSEFRYGGRPVEPLKSLDRQERVVYIGTFSKTMFSGLRIGYAVLPPWLSEPFRRAKSLFEPSTAGLTEQGALSRFMGSGGYGRHLRRMRRHYGRRLAALQQGLRRLPGGMFSFVPANSGLHQYVAWKGEQDSYSAFLNACLSEGLGWSDGAGNWHDKPLESGGTFGFGHLTEDEISAGMQRIRAIAHKLGL
ncbi:PLP-dependent aminotransferase family protein [Paenibacillus beijingensis]|uniref:MocR-like pyridoxine biosynthesis transcription factor PdxR n=1 Tax=Paenibacillus beijingensis TaxID=1126833 RepID=UPI000A61A40B|nr:PLP-dependent aminotransferase family protein [Paenibacillus beijingensis]